MTELREYLEFAVATAHEAGQLTLGHFQTDVTPDFKVDDTPVTMADKRAEESIRHRIEKRFPHHGVLGEEYGETESNSDHRWIIDPIDGTKSFMRGVPLSGVLLALEIEGVVEVGVVYFPALSEMIFAASGRGCFWNGRRCFVRDTATLERSFLSFTDASSFEAYGRQQAWQRLLRAGYYSVGWSDAYGHALVATGRLEVMLDPIMNSWDCGPFPVLLREAGGYFGDWSGNETIYASEGLSTTRTLLPEVLRLIREE
ncbi:MAG: histidinol phosphate phosphatase [Trueperaceae bacterium]|nr:MAG: histidinol phosphate phosphatase [Trueperaceae bacterium]